MPEPRKVIHSLPTEIDTVIDLTVNQFLRHQPGQPKDGYWPGLGFKLHMYAFHSPRRKLETHACAHVWLAAIQIGVTTLWFGACQGVYAAFSVHDRHHHLGKSLPDAEVCKIFSQVPLGTWTPFEEVGPATTAEEWECTGIGLEDYLQRTANTFVVEYMDMLGLKATVPHLSMGFGLKGDTPQKRLCTPLRAHISRTVAKSDSYADRLTARLDYIDEGQGGTALSQAPP